MAKGGPRDCELFLIQNMRPKVVFYLGKCQLDCWSLPQLCYPKKKSGPEAKNGFSRKTSSK
jgi:hypothetical protein